MSDASPHSELLATKDWDVRKVVVFFRNEERRQRYVEFDGRALTDLFEQLEALRQVTEHAVGNLRRHGLEQSARYIEEKLSSFSTPASKP